VEQVANPYNLELGVISLGEIDPTLLNINQFTSGTAEAGQVIVSHASLQSYDLKPATLQEIATTTKIPTSSHDQIVLETVTEHQNQIDEEAQSTRDALDMMERLLETESADEMTPMRSRIAELVGHMRRLEEERHSDWARGLTDEPPPSYISRG